MLINFVLHVFWYDKYANEGLSKYKVRYLHIFKEKINARLNLALDKARFKIIFFILLTLKLKFFLHRRDFGFLYSSFHNSENAVSSQKKYIFNTFVYHYINKCELSMNKSPYENLQNIDMNKTQI